MRSVIIVAVCVAALSSAAFASDISVKLNESQQNALVQLPAVFDQCVAGLTLRSDATLCKNISSFLVGMSNEVKTEAQGVARAEAEKSASAKAEANKATVSPLPAAAPAIPHAAEPAAGK